MLCQKKKRKFIFEHYLYWNKKAPNSQFAVHLFADYSHFGNVAHTYKNLCKFRVSAFQTAELLYYRATQGIKGALYSDLPHHSPNVTMDL